MLQLAAAAGALSLSAAYAPLAAAPQRGGARLGLARAGASPRRGAPQPGGGRCVLVLGSLASALDGAEVGDEMPRRPPPRLKKEMPLHVQEVLRGESTRDDPINDPMRLADFKGLQGYDEAETKTINNELYVKGLPFDLDHEGVRQLFSKAGHRPKSVRILKDRKDKTRSLGFGFVRFKTEQDADAAMRALNGKQLTSDADKGAETKLVISKASAKGKARPMGSKAKKTDFDT